MGKILTIVLLVLSIVAKAQTIHIIVFCATNDKKNGVLSGVAKSAINTKQYFENEFVPDVRRNSGYTVDARYCFDSQFNKSTLESVVNNLSTNSDDVIFFYYCGHGFNVTGSDKEYPKLHLGGMDDARSKWVEEVYAGLRKKQHRLLLTIAEACNRVYDVPNARNGPGSFGPHPTFTKNADNYRTLFSQSGDYLCSSSMRGQASWFDNDWGYFTDCFINAFNYETSVHTSSPTWDNIFATAKQKTEELAYQNAEDQTPQWKKEGGKLMVKVPSLSTDVLLTEFAKSKLDLVFRNSTQTFDNASYKGSISNGKRNGYGAYKWKSGGYYFGEFKDGNPKGRGINISANETWMGVVSEVKGNTIYFEKYTVFNYDNLGHPIYYRWRPVTVKFITTSKGNYYFGQVDINGLYQGYGLFIWSDGRAWVGLFENGQQKEGGYIN